MFQTAQGPAYCSLSARTDSSFPDWKLVHPREADAGLTLKVLSLLCQVCPQSLYWGLSTVPDFKDILLTLIRRNLCSLGFYLTERN